jgi:hypothetical protein
MKQKRTTFIFLFIGLLFMVGSATLLMATPANAQCGSQASSCKNCHETQAQDPVNADGTAWHAQHAFGDFCYLCHAGNNQSTDKTAAHTGMVDPMADIAASCKSCHPADLNAKAQIYATTLGITLGSGGSPSLATTAVATVSNSNPTVQAAAPAVVVASADMVDYSQRYNEVVLGQKPVSVGNIILIILIAAIVLVGGFFVLRREGWINISFDDPKRVPVHQKYPADVLDLLPAIGKLKPEARQTLKTILDKPIAAGDLFASIEQLTKPEPVEEPASSGSTNDEPEIEEQA